MGDDSIFLFVAAYEILWQNVFFIVTATVAAVDADAVYDTECVQRVRVCLFWNMAKSFGIFMLIFNACVSSLCLSLALACFYNIHMHEPEQNTRLFLCIFVYLFPFVVSMIFPSFCCFC